MLAALEDLVVLQHRDQEILALEKELAQLPHSEKKAKAKLSDAQNAVQNAKSALQQNELAIKNLELEIGTRKNTLARLKEQQFETRKNEEYQAIGNDILKYEGQIDELETQELEAMEESDSLQKILEKATAKLSEDEGEVAKELTALQSQATERTGRLNELKESRPALAQPIDEGLLATYERLFATKDALAIVPVNEAKQCQGCHVKVTPVVYSQVMADKTPTQCDNCGRILYPG